MKRNSHLMILILFAVGLSACSASVKTGPPPFEVIGSPGELPQKYGDIRLLFTRTIGGKTSFQVTTLDQKSQVSSTLDSRGYVLRLSPSADAIVYHRLENLKEERRSSLWIKDLGSGEESRIILWEEEFRDESIGSMSFYPQGDRLIFSVTNYSADTTGLASINMDGSGLQRIPVSRNTLNTAPVISPDGSKILVVCEGLDADSGQPGFMLCIMDSDGSDRTLLTENGDSHGDLFFTQDSQRIYYTEYENGGLFEILKKPYYHIKSMNIDGSDKKLILDWHQPVTTLAISPDGEGIVVMDHPDAEKPTRLYLFDQRESKLYHLAYFDEFLADWYADKKKNH
ncbi:MAG: hypothetical protein KGY39_08785 [Anaerolineales bacterium]|nr:hypothetical protein [Anaerolineales bacterium]